MRRASGFTLIELMIAGVLSAVVVFGGFLALSGMQRSGARQTEADEVVAGGRLAIELMAREIRSAGDSLDLMDTPCLGASAHPDRTFQCPAVLEPHPWRIAIARNAWTDSTGLAPGAYRTTDLPPASTRAFATWPENVVMYRFVPYGDGTLRTFGDGRKGYLGRIERVLNPFDFPRGTTASTAQTSVLLDNVLLDDRMREKPDGTQVDHRYDHSLFMYQVLTTSNFFVGGLSVRDTSAADDAFLTPPLRFFGPTAPGALVKVPPYMPDHEPDIVGLETGTTSYEELLRTGSKGMDASVVDSDLRLILDRSVIRTVRIAFKVVGPERTDNTTGLDLDGNPANGRATVYAFETTAEIKPLAPFTVP